MSVKTVKKNNSVKHSDKGESMKLVLTLLLAVFFGQVQAKESFNGMEVYRPVPNKSQCDIFEVEEGVKEVSCLLRFNNSDSEEMSTYLPFKDEVVISFKDDELNDEFEPTATLSNEGDGIPVVLWDAQIVLDLPDRLNGKRIKEIEEFISSQKIVVSFKKDAGQRTGEKITMTLPQGSTQPIISQNSRIGDQDKGGRSPALQKKKHIRAPAVEEL